MEGFTSLSIVLDLTAQPLDGGRPTAEGNIVAIGGMPAGAVSGRPTVGIIVVNRATGERMYAETTMRLFLGAATALKARYESELGDA